MKGTWQKKLDSRHISLVDNDQQLRIVIRLTLEESGEVCLEVNEGQEAVLRQTSW